MRCDECRIDEPLNVEGLAGQLYVQSTNGGAFVWWHLLRDSIKDDFRKQARERIADFVSKNPF